MTNKLVLAGVFLVALAVVYSADNVCPSVCKEYKTCSILSNTNSSSNISAVINKSLVCSNQTDLGVGYLFKNLSDCSLQRAAIETALLFGFEWDQVAMLEAVFGQEDFFKKTCEWDHLAAAVCIYTSLPKTDDTACTNASVTRSTLFCKNECMHLVNSCFNLDKYAQLTSAATSACNDMTTQEATSDKCFKAQIHQEGASSPTCNVLASKTNNTGPYIVAGIALALALVALIGLALITCRNGGDGGKPNSF